MPYKIDDNNLINKYDFDFNSFYNSVISHPTFNNKQSYINKWFNILSKVDCINELYNVESLNYPYEFYFPIFEQEFYFHFNIEKITKMIKKHPFKYMPLYKNIKYFKNNFIAYTYEEYNELHIASIRPIIIVPMMQTNSDFLVIDGNHRVSAKIDNNFKRILCVIYTPNHNYDFYYQIDYIMWLFINEINHYSEQVIKYNADIDKLIKKSVINNLSF